MQATRAINGVTQIMMSDGVAVVTIDAPPVNALSAAVREGLHSALTDTLADRAIDAIVVICGGRTFFAGADINELGKAKTPPTLWQVQALIEEARKPIVAAIHGTALGGGLELALCAHFRIALRSARLGLPEVLLGVLPGAGGTQRLPRLVGIEPALEMMTSGRHVPADECAAIGLLDRVIDDDLEAKAIAFARSVVREDLPLTKLSASPCKLPCTDASAVFNAFRSRNPDLFRGFKAPEAIVQCVEAAVSLPWSEAIAVERRLFQQLLSSQEAGAQRYSFQAERKLRRSPTELGGESARGALIALPSMPAGKGDGNSTAWSATWTEGALRTLIEAGETGEGVPGAAILAAFEHHSAHRGVILVTPDREAPQDPEAPPAKPDQLRVRTHHRSDGKILVEILGRHGTAAAAFSALSRIAAQSGALAVPVLGDGYASDRLAGALRTEIARFEAMGAHTDVLTAALREFGFPSPLAQATVGETAPAPTNGQPLIEPFLCVVVNEAVALLERGQLWRACEVDMLAQVALGWPVYRGGPLWYGDWIGAARVLAVIEDLKRRGAKIAEPTPLLTEAAVQNTRLVDIGR